MQMKSAELTPMYNAERLAMECQRGPSDKITSPNNIQKGVFFGSHPQSSKGNVKPVTQPDKVGKSFDKRTAPSVKPQALPTFGLPAWTSSEPQTPKSNHIRDGVLAIQSKPQSQPLISPRPHKESPEGVVPKGQNVFESLSLALKQTMDFCDKIFDRYNKNKSGFLNAREIYPACSEVFQMNKRPPPTQQQVLHLMRAFDEDSNGLIDKMEFRQLVLKISGLI